MSGWTAAALLPGVWLALLLGLLLWALGRWFDRPPAATPWVLAALMLSLFAPSLVGGKVLFPPGVLHGAQPLRAVLGEPPPASFGGDVAFQVVPWASEVRRAVARGEWPLWGPHLGPGMPLLGNPQTQALQPLAWPALALPLAPGLVVPSALQVAVAFLFMVLLLRRQGAVPAAALLGGVAWSLAGFLQLWLQWPLAASAALLPLLLYAVVRGVDEGGSRDLALLAVALFAVLTAGHPETILYDLLLAAAFALTRLRTVPGRRLRRLAALAVAAGVAAAVAAPAILTAAPQLRASLRHLIVSQRAAPEDGLVAWQGDGRRERLAELERRLVPIAAPNAFGNSRFGHYWGEQNSNEDAAGFAGTLPLLLALLAFLPARRRLAQERVMLAAAAVSLVVLARPPGLRSLVHDLPVLGSSATYHHRLLMVLAFAVAYLAACEVDRWLRRQRRWRLAPLAGLALAALLVWAYRSNPSPEHPGILLALRHRSLLLQGGVLAMGAALAALAARRLAWRQRAAWAVAGLTGVELLLLHAATGRHVSPPAFYPAAPALEFLADHAAGSRILGQRALPANVAAVYGLTDVRISDPLEPAAYHQLTAPLHEGGRRESDRLFYPEHPLYDLLGVRYVLTDRWLRLPLPRAYRGRDGRVYERPGALPRLFLPDAALAAVPPRRWLVWVWENDDFRARAIVEPTARHPGDWQARPRAGEALLRFAWRGPARLDGEAALTEERLLASSLYQDGGWRLLLDRRPLPTLLANGPFVAAWLPAGEHRWALLHRPPGFLPGLLLAGCALGLGMLLWTPHPAAAPAARSPQ
ncbi:MAG TPA: hypothetical protein VMT16_04805 [Thermoanaerobaculia bacterium]|nr:hypothetical protein [Thermoanaerobaculia bacterium]